jgi:hypothetical protein
MSCQIVYGLFVDVVTDDEERPVRRTPIRHGVIEYGLRLVYKIWRIVYVVAGVDIEVGNMVAQLFHIIHTTGFSRTIRIRRPHVGWKTVEYVPKCHFISNYLITSLGACQVFRS